MKMVSTLVQHATCYKPSIQNCDKVTGNRCHSGVPILANSRTLSQEIWQWQVEGTFAVLGPNTMHRLMNDFGILSNCNEISVRW